MSCNELGWVRGKSKPLTHSFFLKLLSSPLPASGGRGRINNRRKQVCAPLYTNRTSAALSERGQMCHRLRKSSGRNP